LRPVRLATFRNGEWPSLAALLGSFVSAGVRPELACVGAAGLVRGGRCRLTNIDWTVAEGDVARACGARRAFVLNDVEALAFGVPALPRGGAMVLAPGRAVRGAPAAVIAAGTGLGAALLVPARGGQVVVATEAGQADFAPRTGRERALCEFLEARLGRVTVERVVSGPGLREIHRFVTEAEGLREVERVRERLAREEAPAVIAAEGQRGRSRACREALSLFAALYGAAAGNIVLTAGAWGGVWLGGGVTAAVARFLAGGAFRAAFVDRGRFREHLAAVPVRAILSPGAALVGAARYALGRGAGA